MATREELNKAKQKEIIDEENREKRKKIIIFMLKVVFFITVAMTIFFLYTTYIANKKIIVKEERIISNNLPDNFNGLKIIQFSDVHFGTTISNSELKELVNIINERNPDIVVFTGDLIDVNYEITPKEQENIIKILKNINASIGKYAIMGDEDSDEFTTIFNQSEFIILNNDYDLIYKNNNTPILLVGLNSSLNNLIDVNKAYGYFSEENHKSDIYTISLLHEPDSVDEIISQHKSDLFLAGHSHNGQIRIPYFGAITKKNGAKKYDQQFYDLESAKLYISSGIGTNQNGIRLFCHPSINFFRLSNK